MANSSKVITIDNLRAFKAKCDETYSPKGESSGGGQLYYTQIFVRSTNFGTYTNTEIGFITKTNYGNNQEMPLENILPKNFRLYVTGSTHNAGSTDYYFPIYIDYDADDGDYGFTSIHSNSYYKFYIGQSTTCNVSSYPLI